MSGMSDFVSSTSSDRSTSRYATRSIHPRGTRYADLGLERRQPPRTFEPSGDEPGQHRVHRVGLPLAIPEMEVADGEVGGHPERGEEPPGGVEVEARVPTGLEPAERGLRGARASRELGLAPADESSRIPDDLGKLRQPCAADRAGGCGSSWHGCTRRHLPAACVRRGGWLSRRPRRRALARSSRIGCDRRSRARPLLETRVWASDSRAEVLKFIRSRDAADRSAAIPDATAERRAADRTAAPGHPMSDGWAAASPDAAARRRSMRRRRDGRHRELRARIAAAPYV